jgi:hypothetical protein
MAGRKPSKEGNGAIADIFTLAGVGISTFVAGWISVTRSFADKVKYLFDEPQKEGRGLKMTPQGEENLSLNSRYKIKKQQISSNPHISGKEFIKELNAIDKWYNNEKAELILEKTGIPKSPVKSFPDKFLALDGGQRFQAIGTFAVVASVTIGIALKMRQSREAGKAQRLRDEKLNTVYAHVVQRYEQEGQPVAALRQ